MSQKLAVLLAVYVSCRGSCRGTVWLCTPFICLYEPESNSRGVHVDTLTVPVVELLAYVDALPLSICVNQKLLVVLVEELVALLTPFGACVNQKLAVLWCL